MSALIETRKGLDSVAYDVRQKLFGVKAAASATALLIDGASCPDDDGEDLADAQVMIQSIRKQLCDIISFINDAEQATMKGGAA
jgi:hypothetical protein